MGAICDCLELSNDEIAEITEIKTAKTPTRMDIFKKSMVKSDIIESFISTSQNTLQYQIPSMMKGSTNSFPQMINEKGILSGRLSCPYNAGVYQEISFDKNNNVHCSCENSEISQEMFLLFLNKFAVGNYKNHKCDLHRNEGEYCLICNNWICYKCKIEYHNKLYNIHHFVSFK